MSNATDKCPHCGADAVESSEYVSFYCGFKPAFNIRTNLCLSRAELAATRKELEECKVSSKRWQSLASGQIQTTAGELAELETLRARVRELEGLEITHAKHFARGTIISFHLARVVDLKSKTLGQAMPRKE